MSDDDYQECRICGNPDKPDGHGCALGTPENERHRLTLRERDQLRAELEETKAQNERMMVQLAGVSTAAMGWIGPETRATRDQWGWSVAYQDTLELRLKHDAARADNAAMAKRLEEAERLLRDARTDRMNDSEWFVRRRAWLLKMVAPSSSPTTEAVAPGSSTGEALNAPVCADCGHCHSGDRCHWQTCGCDRFEPAAPEPAPATGARGLWRSTELGSPWCRDCGKHLNQHGLGSADWYFCPTEAGKAAKARMEPAVPASAQGTTEPNRDSIAEWEKRFGEVPPARFRDLIPLDPLPITENERRRFAELPAAPPQSAPVERHATHMFESDGKKRCAVEGCGLGIGASCHTLPQPPPQEMKRHAFDNAGYQPETSCWWEDLEHGRCGQPRSAAVHGMEDK